MDCARFHRCRHRTQRTPVLTTSAWRPPDTRPGTHRPNTQERLPIDLTSALLGEYRERFCGVSHRWETADEPDTEGTQLAALKAFLSSHPEIEYVWFDFSSMPQVGQQPTRLHSSCVAHRVDQITECFLRGPTYACDAGHRPKRRAEG